MFQLVLFTRLSRSLISSSFSSTSSVPSQSPMLPTCSQMTARKSSVCARVSPSVFVIWPALFLLVNPAYQWQVFASMMWAVLPPFCEGYNRTIRPSLSSVLEHFHDYALLTGPRSLNPSHLYALFAAATLWI